MNSDKWNKYIRIDRIQNEGHGMNFKERVRDLDFISNFVKIQNTKILDVGCETGQIIKYLKDKFSCDVTGITERIYEVNPDIKLGDMHELPFENNIFDIVFIMHTLEHSIAPYIVLSEINRVLKKDGIIVCILPEEGCQSTSDHQHFSVMTFRQIFNLLHKTNFEPVLSLRKELKITYSEIRRDIITIWKKVNSINDWDIITTLVLGVCLSNDGTIRYTAVKELQIHYKDMKSNFMLMTDSLSPYVGGF